jgi:hypothetical protein
MFLLLFCGFFSGFYLLVLFLDTEVPEMVFVGANVIIAIFCPL